MKKILTLITVLSLSFLSCKSSKQNSVQNQQDLDGNWEMTYIKSSEKSLTILYPEKMPYIRINLKEKNISGNNGCNSFSGAFDIKDNNLDLNKPMTATKRYCEGMGETTFMRSLGATKTYSISKDKKTLQFISDNETLIRFKRM